MEMLALSQQKSITKHLIECPCDVQEEFKLSKNTAIVRKVPAAPLRKLIELNLIQGRTINFAKGKDKESKDTLAISQTTGRPCQEYDINWFNNPAALLRTYDTVYCGYCVNVLPPPARGLVWNQLSNLIEDKGIAYVAARTDKDVSKIKTGIPCYDGIRTSVRRTFQHGYESYGLQNEASDYFAYCEEMTLSSEFRLVRCSHAPLPIITR